MFNTKEKKSTKTTYLSQGYGINVFFKLPHKGMIS